MSLGALQSPEQTVVRLGENRLKTPLVQPARHARQHTTKCALNVRLNDYTALMTFLKCSQIPCDGRA